MPSPRICSPNDLQSALPSQPAHAASYLEAAPKARRLRAAFAACLSAESCSIAIEAIEATRLPRCQLLPQDPTLGRPRVGARS